MGAMTDALTCVATVLNAAGITVVIKEFSTVTPPTVEHVVLTVEAAPLERADVDAFTGDLTVTAEWFHPGVATDGQAEFLAAMDAFEALLTALAAGLDRTCIGLDPGGNIARENESAALAHWYSGIMSATFMRKEP